MASMRVLGVGVAALAVVALGVELNPIVRRVKPIKPVRMVSDFAKPILATHDDDETVHIVFSTDCSGYQHWQGIALWYAAQEAQHLGPITRIASGCQELQQAAIAVEWRKIDSTGRFRVHFTPDMALHGNNYSRFGYQYSNKPGGIVHWLRNAAIAERYVCLIDPDMLLLKPITTSLAEGLTMRLHPNGKHIEMVDNDGIARVLRVNDEKLVELPAKVTRGHPAGQHFGVGGQWAQAGQPHPLPAWVNFSKAKVCGDGAPCTKTSISDADHKYAVGPVYLAHVDDWRRIAQAWLSGMPHVHKQYPKLLAEMYAMTMGVANLTLPWTLVSSYMVSSTGGHPTEAWAWVDDISKVHGNDAVCAGANTTTLPVVTRNRKLALPTVLHHCQKYNKSGHVFWKRDIAHDFFRCDGKPLPFDAGALIAGLGDSPSPKDLRTTFMLCHLIPMTNHALMKYKQDTCWSAFRVAAEKAVVRHQRYRR